MQIFVNAQQRHVLTLADDATAMDVKARVAVLEGLPLEAIYLTCGGHLLAADEQTLAQSGVQPLATVEVGVRMLGGKVHGSLARAGKVKGQTPKIEKKEKKKEKTGELWARSWSARPAAGGAPSSLCISSVLMGVSVCCKSAVTWVSVCCKSTGRPEGGKHRSQKISLQLHVTGLELWSYIFCKLREY